MAFEEIINIFGNNFPLLRTIIIVIVLIFLFNFTIGRIKKRLLKKSKSKKQISNVKIFTRLLSIAFVVITISVAFFSYIGSWTGLGFVVGLITAGLGFALQKPITGIAAWMMVIVKRPFNIGDRVSIGDVCGEVYDISLTHVYIDEIGGDIDSSLHSGKNIMIPNHLLFEHNIINYTLTNEYILEEVNFDVTYESDLDLAIKVGRESATKFLTDYLKESKREIKIRVKMEASGMKVRVLFYAPVKEIYKISGEITKEIYDRIKREKNVEIAYPHSEIIFKNKKLFRR